MSLVASSGETHCGYYLFKFLGDEKIITPNHGEVRTYKWVAYDDLKDYLLFDNQLEDTSEKIKEIFTFVKNRAKGLKGS